MPAQSANLQGRDRLILELTAQIVKSYMANASASAQEIGPTLARIKCALEACVPTKQKQTPVVPIDVSVTEDYIICLENGRKFKTLKRHLAAAYGMSPQEYRMKWGLPAEYPMVAERYRAERSLSAKRLGLGKQHQRRSAEHRRELPTSEAAG